MRTICFVAALLLCQDGYSQDLKAKLAAAMNSMSRNPQFSHANIGLYITDSSGRTIYSYNADAGLVPGSSQKVITSITSFEVLGKDFNYTTAITCDGPIADNTLDGNLYFIGSGDPTLGSWRWNETKEEAILKKIADILSTNAIKKINGRINIDTRKYIYQPIPDGWIWEDIGNYYGAGAWGFNWHENQYDLHLRSSETGSKTEVLSTSPFDFTSRISNEIRAGKRGSGDNAYLYSAPYHQRIFATGTIPPDEKDFVISGSVSDPPAAFRNKIYAYVRSINITMDQSMETFLRLSKAASDKMDTLGVLISPTFDSMNYWFMKKSINLYGEAFVKSIAVKSNREASTEAGIELIRDFWKKNGIERSALKMEDGSGLSPANRVTAKALVHVLKYAKNKKWYPSFFQSLPVYNGIRMKSGTIGGVKAFAGYHRSKQGKEYIFAFIINNFDGSSSVATEKMYKVLDLLK